MAKSARPVTRRDVIVNALGAKSSHLPGNTMWQDWSQYVITNNHTLFGIFCFHPLHPLRYSVRIVALVGSLAMSMTIYNLIYVYFQRIENTTIVSFVNGTGRFVEHFVGEQYPSEKLVLSLCGSPFLSLFDSVIIWHIATLPCCLPGRICAEYAHLRWLGLAAVIVVVFLTTIASIWLIIERRGVEADKEQLAKEIAGFAPSGGIMDDMLVFEEAFESAVAGETDAGDLIWGAVIQWLFVMLFTRIAVSSLRFIYKRHSDYDKYELKWSEVEKSRRGTDSDTDNEDFSEYNGNDEERGSHYGGSDDDHDNVADDVDDNDSAVDNSETSDSADEDSDSDMNDSAVDNSEASNSAGEASDSDTNDSDSNNSEASDSAGEDSDSNTNDSDSDKSDDSYEEDKV